MFVHCLGVGYTYQVALRDVRALLRFRHNGTATAGAYGTLPTLPLFAGLLTHIDCFVKKEKITPITKRTNARLHAHTHARKHARTHACTYTLTDTHTRTHAYTHVNAHVRAQGHTHTHTHTHIARK